MKPFELILCQEVKEKQQISSALPLFLRDSRKCIISVISDFKAQKGRAILISDHLMAKISHFREPFQKI